MSKSDVKATLKKIDADLKALDRQDDVCAQDYDPILGKLERILSSVQNQPKLRKAIAPHYRRARQAHRGWQEYEQQYGHIVDLPRMGDWKTAIIKLSLALRVFEENIPDRLRQQWENWQAVLSDLGEAIDLVEGNVYAEGIGREARRLEQRWQNMVRIQ